MTPEIIDLDLDRIAHGGHAVGRHDGRVVFVRHGIPGERVRARITGEGRKGRFRFADTLEVLTPSPHRVDPPCPLAGECGGCDFQHIDAAYQRTLKAEVLAEQLQRLGGVETAVSVLAVGDGPLGWRTRTRFAPDSTGRLGLRRQGSHDVVAVPTCPIATESVNAGLAAVADVRWDSDLVIVDQPGEPALVPVPDPSGTTVVEHAGGREWQVAATGFWQAHALAADTLVDAVAPHVLEVSEWWDLYAGVGLFAGCLAIPGQRVTAVEGDRRAVAAARLNLTDKPWVRVVRADVAEWLPGPGSARPQVIVADPPRAGLGKAVVEGVSATGAQTLVLVSCDPAALGRDTGLLRQSGWGLTTVTGYDLFPMTHHIEAIAVFTR